MRTVVATVAAESEAEVDVVSLIESLRYTNPASTDFVGATIVVNAGSENWRGKAR